MELVCFNFYILVFISNNGEKASLNLKLIQSLNPNTINWSACKEIDVSYTLTSNPNIPNSIWTVFLSFFPCKKQQWMGQKLMLNQLIVSLMG